MDRSDASALADLQMHWDEAYAIGLDGDIWSARFHGATDELRAHTAGELRELIRTDYWYRQRASSTRAGTVPADNLAGTSYEDAAEGAGSYTSDDAADDTGSEPLRTADFAAIRGEGMSI